MEDRKSVISEQLSNLSVKDLQHLKIATKALLNIIVTQIDTINVSLNF